MKYEEQKRERANHKPKQDTKEIKVSPRIQKHDIETFVKRAIKFLEHGDKVKVTCVFKQRELEHPELGLAKIKTVLEELNEYCVYEGEPTLQGKIMSIIVNPKK
jgi:translation initiation factor IF-3